MAKYELEDKLENYYKNIYNELEQKTLDDEFGSYVLNRLKTGNKKATAPLKSEMQWLFP